MTTPCGPFGTGTLVRTLFCTVSITATASSLKSPTYALGGPAAVRLSVTTDAPNALTAPTTNTTRFNIWSPPEHVGSFTPANVTVEDSFPSASRTIEPWAISGGRTYSKVAPVALPYWASASSELAPTATTVA